MYIKFVGAIFVRRLLYVFVFFDCHYEVHCWVVADSNPMWVDLQNAVSQIICQLAVFGDDFSSET
jgi:hypothetical protein